MSTEVLSAQTLVSKSMLLMAVKLVATFLAFVFHLIIARQLSMQEFGLFSLASTCLIFSQAFSKQGLENAIVRYFAKQADNTVQSLYVQILYLTVRNCVIVGLLLFVLGDTLSDMLHTVMLGELIPTIIMLTFLQTWLSVNSAVLRGREYSVSSIVFSGLVTYCLAVLMLIFTDVHSALDALTLILCSAVIATVASFVMIWKKLHFKRILAFFKLTKFPEINQLRRTSNVLFVSALASLLTQQFVLFILARELSLDEVGLYSIALKISLLLAYPLLVINVITAPKYANLFEQGRFSEFKQLAWLSTKYLIALASVILCVVCFLSEQIIALFGEKYATAAPILVILTIGQWFNLATGTVVSMLVMTGYEKVHRSISVLIAVITIIAVYMLIPDYGIFAAAWIAAIGMAVSNILSFCCVNKLIYSRRTDSL